MAQSASALAPGATLCDTLEALLGRDILVLETPQGTAGVSGLPDLLEEGSARGRIVSISNRGLNLFPSSYQTGSFA